MMNRLQYKAGWLILLGMIILLSGCGQTENESKLSAGNQVEDILNQKILEENVSTDIEVTEDISEQTSDSSEEITGEVPESMTDEISDVDYDLTQMGSDMIYATVFQMMTTPKEYTGKRIRMQGRYYATWYEATSKYYHYVVVQDAMACCVQGIEFVWGDGTHIYPDEYPEENADVEVTGVFETYTEEGDDNLYCRLKEAELVIR